ELFVQRRADAVRDPAVRHAVHDVRVDHHAAVVAADVFPDRGLAGVRVDLHQYDVRLEGVAGVDLYAALGSREGASGRHSPHELRLQPRLQGGRQLVELPVRDFDELVPVQPFLLCTLQAHAAVPVFEVPGRAFEVVRGDG